MEEKAQQTYYRLNQQQVAMCCGQIITKFSTESDTDSNCNPTL